MEKYGSENVTETKDTYHSKQKFETQQFWVFGYKEMKSWLLGTDTSSLPKWLCEISSVTHIWGKCIPFDELYQIIYNSELTEEEWNNALLNFVINKYIHVNAEANLAAKEIIEKNKKLEDKSVCNKKRKFLVGVREIMEMMIMNEDKKGLLLGGTHVDNP